MSVRGPGDCELGWEGAGPRHGSPSLGGFCLPGLPSGDTHGFSPNAGRSLQPTAPSRVSEHLLCAQDHFPAGGQAPGGGAGHVPVSLPASPAGRGGHRPAHGLCHQLGADGQGSPPAASRSPLGWCHTHPQLGTRLLPVLGADSAPAPAPLRLLLPASAVTGSGNQGGTPVYRTQLFIVLFYFF